MCGDQEGKLRAGDRDPRPNYDTSLRSKPEGDIWAGRVGKDDVGIKFSDAGTEWRMTLDEGTAHDLAASIMDVVAPAGQAMLEPEEPQVLEPSEGVKDSGLGLTDAEALLDAAERLEKLRGVLAEMRVYEDRDTSWRSSAVLMRFKLDRLIEDLQPLAVDLRVLSRFVGLEIQARIREAHQSDGSRMAEKAIEDAVLVERELGGMVRLRFPDAYGPGSNDLTVTPGVARFISDHLHRLLGPGF